MLRLTTAAGLVIWGISAVNAKAQAPTPPTVRADVKWTPMPIRSDKQAQMGMKGGEGGQCLHGIARCLADDRRIYLAVDVVGVWRSKDGGVNWEPCKYEGVYNLGTDSVEVSPTNPDRVFAFTDAEWEKMREPEEGLYMSADGGDTWKRVLQVKNEDARRGSRHLIDAARDGKRMYFAAYNAGVYRSDDAGETWTGPTGPTNIPAFEIRADPKNVDTVWLATDEGLHVSRDGAKTFSRIDPLSDETISSVAPDPIRPNRLHLVQQGKGLLRTDDGGKTFTPLSSGDADLDRTAVVLFQSPVNSGRMILAADKKMRVTLDGGVKWAKPDVDFSKSYVQQGSWGFHEGLAWGSKNPNSVVGALSCGMYASRDAGVTWFDAGAGYLGFHHGWSDQAVALAADDPNRFAFFCYDYAFNITNNGGRSFQYGRLKQQVRGWWGMYCGDLHPNFKQEPTVISAAGKYFNQQLVRSDDAGKTWTPIPGTEGAYFFVRYHPKNPSIVYASNMRSDDGGRSFAKLEKSILALAPSQPDTVYAYDAGKVWRSDDRGQSWKALPNPPRKAGDEVSRRDLEVHPTDPNHVWAMTAPDSAVFDGKSWTTIPASKWVDPKAHAFVSRMAYDPDRPDRMVLGLDAQGTGYLFLSDDAGKTWSDITANLPRLGTSQSLNIQPKTGRIFMGAGFGTYTTIIPPK
jgi:photosystem II stability/assembly factor-like uncharacterized protein